MTVFFSIDCRIHRIVHIPARCANSTKIFVVFPFQIRRQVHMQIWAIDGIKIFKAQRRVSVLFNQNSFSLYGMCAGHKQPFRHDMRNLRHGIRCKRGNTCGFPHCLVQHGLLLRTQRAFCKGRNRRHIIRHLYPPQRRKQIPRGSRATENTQRYEKFFQRVQGRNKKIVAKTAKKAKILDAGGISPPERHRYAVADENAFHVYFRFVRF